jgi:hypothetical protein
MSFRGMIQLLSMVFLIAACQRPDLPNPQLHQNFGLPAQVLEFGKFNKIGAPNTKPNHLKFEFPNGDPVGNAEVLIGSSVDFEFKGNFVVTDSDGFLPIPSGWAKPLMLTISPKNGVRTSFTDVEPTEKVFLIRPKLHDDVVELNGETPGIRVVDKDNKADFVLTVPVYDRSNLLSLQVADILSPEKDEIKAGGQKIYIPSNVTMPRQKETYFISLTIDKPKYRSFFNHLGAQKIFSVRGQFPFRQVVDKLRNNTELIELVNHFNLLGGGMSAIDLVPGANTLNNAVDKFTFSSAIGIQVPDFDPNESVLSMSLHVENGEIFPLDIKAGSPNQRIGLKSLDPQKTSYFSILKNRSELKSGPGASRNSFVLVDDFKNSVPTHLPLLKSPKLVTWAHFKIDPWLAPKNLSEMATIAVLTRTLKRTLSGTIGTPVWEVYSNKWMTEVKLPSWPKQPDWTKGYSWQYMALGCETQCASATNPDLRVLGQATHLTTSSVDF